MGLAFSVITLLSGLSYGSLETVKDKAARYFSGHISITGFQPPLIQRISDPYTIERELIPLKKTIRTVARRSFYYNADAVLFFSGERIQQRKVIGVDFNSEGKEFDRMTFSSGNWKILKDAKHPGILISVTAAKLLHCQVGDAITIFLTSDSGQYNSADFIVSGIFLEKSLFGYAAYLDIEVLNSLVQRPIGSSTDIAIYVADGADIESTAKRIIGQLSYHHTVKPLFRSREERDARLAAGVAEPTLVIMTQDAQLAQIKQLLDALLYISYFVMGVFLLIIMAGILNTYRVIIHNRRREIGVLRALGMKKAHVAIIFLHEAALISIFASVAGLVLSYLLLRFASTIDLSVIPGAALFTENGYLRLRLVPKLCALNFALITSAALIAVWGPASQAARIAPTEAMRSA